VQFTTAMELLGSLVKGQQQGTLEPRLAQYAKPKLLIIDELGYLPLEPQAGHLFFQLISRRYEQGSVLISSNRPVEEWDEIFGDQVVAAAILDRLMHHSHVVTIRGDSYRLREKRRAGMFRVQAARTSSSGGGGGGGRTATDTTRGGLRTNSTSGSQGDQQPMQPITETMSSKRHPRNQGGNTPTTAPQNSPEVVQFSVSQVAQFSMSLDTAYVRNPQTSPTRQWWPCSSPPA
jgi:hypothetical protein